MSVDDGDARGPKVTNVGGLPEPARVGRRYVHAPITEAALSLGVVPAPGVTPEDFSSFFANTAAFSEPAPRYLHETGEWNDQGERVQSRSVGAYYAKAKDGKYGVTASPNLFGFSLIGEYTEWHSFMSSAEECWNAFRGVAHPSEVTYASARFVNRINPPSEGFEIDDYVRTSFRVSPYLPQVVTDFYSQISVILNIDEKYRLTATITVYGTEPASAKHAGGIVLDIDVGTNISLSTSDSDFNQNLDAAFERLRYAKNYVFESCITDATRNLIS